MKIVRCLTGLAIAALAVAPLLATRADAQTAYERYRKGRDVVTEREDNATVMLGAGKALLAKAPPEIRNGTALDKAKYAFAYYTATLAANDIPVNDNYWRRFQAFVQHGNESTWSCGDHAVNLTELFKGMGIKSDEMTDFLADENSYSGMVTPNGNHGAVAIWSGGKAFFFDPWQLARENGGSYSGGGRSRWNAMDQDAWEAEMRKQGYVRFSSNGGETFGKSLLEVIPSDRLPPISPRQKPAATPLQIPRNMTMSQCEQLLCAPDSKACFEKRCSPVMTSGCRAPCTYIYNNMGLDVCRVLVNDNSPCATAYATQATTCFKKCWEKDGDAVACAEQCKKTADADLSECKLRGLPPAADANAAMGRIAAVAEIRGTPTITTNGVARPLRPGDNISLGDVIKTRDGERVKLEASDGEIRVVTSNSTLTMQRRTSPTGNAELLEKFLGEVEATSSPSQTIDGLGHVVTGGRLDMTNVEYRQFSRVRYRFDDNEDVVTVFEGRVEATDPRTGDRLTIPAGRVLRLAVGRPLREARLTSADETPVAEPSRPSIAPATPASTPSRSGGRVTSSFANDAEGWTGGSFPDNGPYDVVIASAPVTWNRGAGRVGGALSMTDPGAGNFFFQAPSAFLGSKSSLYGGSLRYDFRSEGGEIFDEADVILLGAGRVLVFRAAERPSTTWATTTVPFTESAWHVDRLTGSAPSRADFERVLANITAIRIRGEYRNGPETAWLSNVVLSPGAATTPGAGSSAVLSGSWEGTWKNSRGETGRFVIALEVSADGSVTGTDDGEKIIDGRRDGDTMTWTMRAANGRWWSETVRIQDGGSTLVANYTGHDSRGTYTGGGTLRKR